MLFYELIHATLTERRRRGKRWFPIMVEINNEYKHNRINRSIGIKPMNYCQLLTYNRILIKHNQKYCINVSLIYDGFLFAIKGVCRVPIIFD